MDRRSFLFGLCGFGAASAGATALTPLLMQPAAATPLEMLKNIPSAEGSEIADEYGVAPDGTPADSAYWVWRNGRRVWIAPRRRRRVCRRVRTRSGWRTQCWWR